MERSSCWNCICWKNWGAASILRDVGKDSVLNSHQFYNWRICNLCISGEVWPIETSIREPLQIGAVPPLLSEVFVRKRGFPLVPQSWYLYLVRAQIIHVGVINFAYKECANTRYGYRDGRHTRCISLIISLICSAIVSVPLKCQPNQRSSPAFNRPIKN